MLPPELLGQVDGELLQLLEQALSGAGGNILQGLRLSGSGDGSQGQQAQEEEEEEGEVIRAGSLWGIGADVKQLRSMGMGQWCCTWAQQQQQWQGAGRRNGADDKVSVRSLLPGCYPSHSEDLNADWYVAACRVLKQCLAWLALLLYRRGTSSRQSPQQATWLS